MNPEWKEFEKETGFINTSEYQEKPVRGLSSEINRWFDDIYKQYNVVVFKIAYRILKDRALAEDARQDALCNIYRGLQYFRGESKVSTWITRITVNVCLGILRKKKRYAELDLDGNEEWCSQIAALDNTNPYRTCSAAETKERIHRALNGISNKHGIVVQLHDLEGQTIPEISKLLQVPSGTVKSRLFYGRQELKEWLCNAPAFVHAG